MLGAFALWEADGSWKVELPLASISSDRVSFTMTGELFTLGELREQVDSHGLPGDAWRSDPTRIFDVYIGAQIWRDAPLLPLLSGGFHSTR